MVSETVGFLRALALLGAVLLIWELCVWAVWRIEQWLFFRGVRPFANGKK